MSNFFWKNLKLVIEYLYDQDTRKNNFLEKVTYYETYCSQKSSASRKDVDDIASAERSAFNLLAIFELQKIACQHQKNFLEELEGVENQIFQAVGDEKFSLAIFKVWHAKGIALSEQAMKIEQQQLMQTIETINTPFSNELLEVDAVEERQGEDTESFWKTCETKAKVQHRETVVRLKKEWFPFFQIDREVSEEEVRKFVGNKEDKEFFAQFLYRKLLVASMRQGDANIQTHVKNVMHHRLGIEQQFAEMSVPFSHHLSAFSIKAYFQFIALHGSIEVQQKTKNIDWHLNADDHQIETSPLLILPTSITTLFTIPQKKKNFFYFDHNRLLKIVTYNAPILIEQSWTMHHLKSHSEESAQSVEFDICMVEMQWKNIRQDETLLYQNSNELLFNLQQKESLWFPSIFKKSNQLIMLFSFEVLKRYYEGLVIQRHALKMIKKDFLRWMSCVEQNPCMVLTVQSKIVEWAQELKSNFNRFAAQLNQYYQRYEKAYAPFSTLPQNFKIDFDSFNKQQRSIDEILSSTQQIKTMLKPSSRSALSEKSSSEDMQQFENGLKQTLANGQLIAPMDLAILCRTYGKQVEMQQRMALWIEQKVFLDQLMKNIQKSFKEITQRKNFPDAIKQYIYQVVDYLKSIGHEEYLQTIKENAKFILQQEKGIDAPAMSVMKENLLQLVQYIGDSKNEVLSFLNQHFQKLKEQKIQADHDFEAQLHTSGLDAQFVKLLQKVHRQMLIERKIHSREVIYSLPIDEQNYLDHFLKKSSIDWIPCLEKAVLINLQVQQFDSLLNDFKQLKDQVTDMSSVSLEVLFKKYELLNFEHFKKGGEAHAQFTFR
jgi:hypothetical protein